MPNLASESMNVAGWVLVLLYALIILGFVIRGARRNKSMADYAVGNLSFSPVAVGLALAASMTSAATFIINPGFIALYGISGVISYGVVLPLAAVVSLVILTKRFRRHGTSVKALSMAQWISSRYDSSALGFFFGVLSLLLITFIVLIVVGLTKVLSTTLGLGEMTALFGVVVFVFGYMMFGGANSMVYTNTIQAVLMLIVAWVLLGSGYEHFSSGIKGFLDKLAAVDPVLVQPTNPNSFLFRSWFEIIFAQIVVGVAVVCQPHIITKSLLLKTDRDVNRYLIVGVVTELIFFAVVFVGLYVRLSFPDLQAGGVAMKMDSLIPAYVVQEFPVWLGLVVVLGLISAGLSTLEGLVQALSTTITSDLIRPLAGDLIPADTTEAGGRTLLMISRLVMVVLAVVTVVLSRDQLLHPKLSVAIFAQNGVYAYFSAAFVPLLFGMFLPRTNKVVAAAAAIMALVIHFSMYYGKLPVPGTSATGENPGVAAAVAIVLALLVGWVLYKLKIGGEHVSS